MTATLGYPLPPDRALFAELADGIWDRGRWSNGGPLVSAFERQLEEETGWSQAVATASGTAALTTALLSLGLPLGGEVITTPLSFRATPLAIEAAGLTPVFAAVDVETLTLDPTAVQRAIGERTVAILPVHLFGIGADPSLDDLASAHSLPVVYDAAHAYGLFNIVGRGSLTAYSLHATKLLHTGEGGFIATRSPELSLAARNAVNFGIDGVGDLRAGTNGKMSELAAAVGLATLPMLPAEIAAREELREAYTAAAGTGRRLRVHAPGQDRALVMEVVRCSPGDQARIVAQLAERDVAARVFPALTADGQRYAERAIAGGTTEKMTELARTAIALPFHGNIQRLHIDAITEVLSQ